MNAFEASSPPTRRKAGQGIRRREENKTAVLRPLAGGGAVLRILGNQGERVAALVLIALGAIMVRTAVGYGLYPDEQPGPGLFPALTAAALILLAVLWLLMGFRKNHAGAGDGSVPPSGEPVEGADGFGDDPADTGDGTPSEAAAQGRSGNRVIAFTFVWSLVPLTLLDSIGFVPAMTIYVGGMLLVIARAKPWICLPVTAVASLVAGVGLDALGIILPDPLNLLSLLGV